MLSIRNNSRFISKRLTSKTGEVFDVLFYVYTEGSKNRAEIISINKVSDLLLNESKSIISKTSKSKYFGNKILCLSSSCPTNSFCNYFKEGYGSIKDFIPFSSIIFSISQPIRAPSYL